MDCVKFGRVWEINSLEDYQKAMEILEGNDFIAEMSDDFGVWQREKDEVRSQKESVIRQAKEKGLIE